MIIWDTWNINHIAQHHVEPEEVEEALIDPYRFKAPAHGKGKKVLIGQSEDGRFLWIVFAKQENGIYVITAREAEEHEKKWYRRRNR